MKNTLQNLIKQEYLKQCLRDTLDDQVATFMPIGIVYFFKVVDV